MKIFITISPAITGYLRKTQTMKKVFIRTFGCQMNEYDSEKMLAVLAEENGGIEQVTEADEADIILFNTCSVREKAQEKVFSDLGRVRPLKEKNPDLIIGVAGCVASQEGENIIKRAPYVDVVFGPQTLHRLPKMIVDKETSGLSQVDISFPEIEKFDHLPPARVEGGAAFVSIMEGCSKYCSFCVVPYTRGEEFSRPLNDVLTEIANLAQQGVKEINLLGQNVNAYRGEMEDGEICDFATLLRIVHEIPGIERMRFTTSHPREFTDSIIECYRDLPKLVSHLHLPIQSGSDRLHRLGIQIHHPQTARHPPRLVPEQRLHRRLPRRNRARVRADPEAGERHRFRFELRLHLQPAPRHTCRQPAGRHPACRKSAPPRSPE